MTRGDSVPDGFQAMQGLQGFNAHLQPMYIKLAEDTVNFGIQLNDSHLNRMQNCHGGVYMTLMDFASNVQVCLAVDKFVAAPTLSFSLDFMAPAGPGDFIWTEVEVLKTTRNFAVTRGLLRCGENVLARTNATFKLPSDIAAADGVSVTEFARHFLHQG